jgi:exonuclease SbcD
MKILHTADWHLGQTFMQKSRKEEHQQFIDWLLKTLQEEQIAVVIIAGDIFDVANPAIEAMDLYHTFLLKAYQLGVEVIVVGGNHDSAARLNTTGALLSLLHVHVVGGEMGALGKLIPLRDKVSQEVYAVVVAVPYLRDADIRKIAEGEEVLAAHHQFAASIQKHYDALLLQANAQFPKAPVIGTAHLYVNGSTVSDSTKENMHAIGTLGQIASGAFSEGYHYIAMGHIHKPQVIAHQGSVVVKYAGSPIPLSFSERDDHKEVTVIELLGNQFVYTVLQVPLFRPLIRFKGSANKVVTALAAYQHQTVLPAWGEIILTESVDFIAFNQEVAQSCIDNQIEILNRQLLIDQSVHQSVREAYVAGADNNPLENTREIFKLKCEKSGLDETNIDTLMPLFDEILAQVKESN